MKDKLKKYGFSESQTEKLLKGKEIDTPYGIVKLNNKTGELKTVLHRTKETKIEQL